MPTISFVNLVLLALAAVLAVGLAVTVMTPVRSDGAPEPRDRAPGDVDVVIRSRFHIDDTDGLSALLALRYQQHIAGSLTVYGPPGTRQLVDGLLRAESALVKLSEAESPRVPPSDVEVVEIHDGATFPVDGVTNQRGREHARAHHVRPAHGLHLPR